VDIGVLGTGMVGRTLATSFVALGHLVTMGGRAAGNPAALEWVRAAPVGGPSAGTAREGSFAQAAGASAVVINATNGAHSLEALEMAGADNLDGKVLIDVANPLDFSHGMPPTLTVCNTDSLGEQIQRRFPAARVVKTLNTVSTDVMVDPGRVPGGHTMFVCGDDPAAKETATGLLVELGWTRDDVMDLGDITACRGTEMYLPLWLCLRARAGSTLLNIRVVSR